MTIDTPKPRGGKRVGAGRKPLAENQRKHTVLIRVDASLIPTIERLKSGDLIHCTENQITELRRQIAELKRAKENIEDARRLQVTDLEKQNRRLKEQVIFEQGKVKSLKADTKVLEKALKKFTGKKGN